MARPKKLDRRPRNGSRVALFLAAALFLLGAASPPIFKKSEAALDSYLADLAIREPSFGERLADVAKRSLGTPYAEGPLGEGPRGKYDKDPLIDLTRADCVTFVEQTIALAASTSYKEALETLRRIRYRDGQISFESRNHFMIADWIANNTFCRDVTRKLCVPTRTTSRKISRKDFFVRVNAPELGRDTSDQTIELVYVASAEVRAAEKNLPSPALIVFIGKVDWLFALHCGFYVRDDEGEGLLYHASSKAGRVVAENLADYLEDSTRYLGFTAYDIAEPEGADRPSATP